MQAEILDSTVSNSMQLFQNAGFKIRVVMRGDEPWFVAKDACDCLEIGNTSKVLANLDEDDKFRLTRDELDTLISSEGIKCSVDSRVQSLNLVSESGLYDLIMQSRKPEAKAFKRWVTHEVLPSIRKTGSYGGLSDAEIMSRALEIARRTLALREERIKALTAERDEAVRTKTQYQSNLASQMSGRVGGLTSALNRVRLENDRLKGDRLTKEDVYIIMNTQGVSFTLKTVKDVIL